MMIELLTAIKAVGFSFEGCTGWHENLDQQKSLFFAKNNTE